jgi:similar to stage IV sporulation protein
LLSFRLFNSFYGYLTINITGIAPEKFINLCTRKGIVLWDMNWKENNMHAKIRISDFRRIRPLVRKTHCTVAIITRHGFPFFMHRARNRKMLIAGGVLFCICLYLLSSFIWFVEVGGLISLPPEAVLHVARQAGLKPGVFKSNVDLKQVEHSLLVQIPDIAWAGITVRGTRAMIEVAEKTVVYAEDKAPANIIAAKDGLVEELIALVGEAMVHRGETVRKGQLLISGVMIQKTKDMAGNLAPIPDAPARVVQAKGIAKARIWYQSYGEAGLFKEVSSRTGRTCTHVVLKVGEVERIIKQGSIPFLYYEVEEVSKNLPAWRNKSIPVESKIVTYYEIERSQIPLTPEEAREEAKRIALAVLQEQVPESVQVLSRNIEVLKTAETDLVRVKVIVETLEDIGMAQHIHNAQ